MHSWGIQLLQMRQSTEPFSVILIPRVCTRCFLLLSYTNSCHFPLHTAPKLINYSKWEKWTRFAWLLLCKWLMYKSFHIRKDWKKLRKELMEHGLQKELWSRLKYTWTDCYQLSVKPSSNRCLVGYEREKKDRKKTRTSMN